MINCQCLQSRDSKTVYNFDLSLSCYMILGDIFELFANYTKKKNSKVLFRYLYSMTKKEKKSYQE